MLVDTKYMRTELLQFPGVPKRDRFDFLDAVRGVAALVVVIEHGLHNCFPKYLEFSRANFITGQIAIIAFFMVSGFVIPMSLEAGGSVIAFWRRRCFRLVPVYWFSIALAFVAMFVGGPFVRFRDLDATTWLSNLTLTQACFNRPHVWGVFWTLGYELLIYFACSLLFVTGMFDRIGPRTLFAIVAGFAIIGVGRPIVIGEPFELGGLRIVVMSALFGLAAHRYIVGRLNCANFYGLVGALTGAVLLIWSVNRVYFPTVVTLHNLVTFGLVWAAAFALFAIAVELRHRSMPRWMCWLGRRSYPIYLLHPFVIALMANAALSAKSYMSILMMGTLAAAAIVHRYIERPGISLGTLFEKPKRQPIAPEIPTVRRAA
jgi:peptidoglycan/LPS O-acetylase OafA/YrhL